MPGAPDFNELYRSELSYVWNSLRRLGAQPKDLEDLAHDVFIAAYRRLGSYDTSRPIRPWLFGIAFRVFSDFRRLAHNQREVSEEEPPEMVDEAPAGEAQVEKAEVRALVREALESVELSRRAVFVMHELDGSSIPEVAEALGIPLNTAYSRLRLARGEFAAALKRIKLRLGEP